MQTSSTFLHTHGSSANSDRAIIGALRKLSFRAYRFTKGIRIWHACTIASTTEEISVAVILTPRPCHETSDAVVCSASEGDDRALVKILKYLSTQLGYTDKLMETT